MTKTLSARTPDGYGDLRRQDLRAVTGLAAKLAEASEPLRRAPITVDPHDMGALSWMQTNW